MLSLLHIPRGFPGNKMDCPVCFKQKNEEWINKFVNNSMPHFAYLLEREEADSLSIRNVLIMQKWQSRCTYS